jgi:hypothetical protein
LNDHEKQLHRQAAFTAAEVEALDLSARLWNALVALPHLHNMDAAESARDVHNIQNRLLGRLAVRRVGEIRKGDRP